MLISDQGTLVRTRVDEVSSLSRNTQGVTLIRLASDETLVGLERVQEPTVSDDVDAQDDDGAEHAVEASTDDAPAVEHDDVSTGAESVADESNNPKE